MVYVPAGGDRGEISAKNRRKFYHFEVNILEIKGKNLSNLSNETIKTYSKMLNKFEKSGKDIKKFAREELKNKNEISMFKNALKYAKEADRNSSIREVDISKVNRIAREKPKRRAKPREQFNVLSFWNSINASRNIKHKLPFRLSVLSGLRIAELANLKKENITFLEDGRIRINVINGKGGKDRTVTTIMKDKYLYDNLKEHILNRNKDKVFYSKDYLHKIAKKHNFKNHDLRKACVQKIYYCCYENEAKTVKLVQKYLGHSEGSKTYKYYIDRDINATGTKLDIKAKKKGDNVC